MKTRFYVILFMALMLLTQTSCVYDNDSAVPCDSEDTEALIISLNLTVPASSATTRSADDNHFLVPANCDESYINIAEEDYQILIFDKYGDLTEGKLSEIECKQNGTSGGNTSYTLTARLSLSGNEDRDKLSQFKVMVLANWKSFERSNTDSGYEYPSFAGYSLSGATKNIYKDGGNFNFTFKEQPNNFSWVPSMGENKAIPMFGITGNLDLQYVMDMSRYGDGPSFSVPMLRALAKVEIIDEVGDKIASVSMAKANESGRFIPEIDEETGTNTQWGDKDVQIETPSLPTDPGNISKIEFVPGPKTADGKSTWIAYIPEMDFTNNENQRPQFTVYNGITELEPFSFNNYNEGSVVTNTAKYLLYVLRNHIYSFRVTINDSGIEITSDILPWNMIYEPSPSYFDTPKVAEDGYLAWKTKYDANDKVDEGFIGEENGYRYDSQTLELVMKNTLEEYAQATFKLETPKNCRWYAALVNNTGKGDAFYFVDDEGNEITANNGQPYGVIDGKEATIRLKVRRQEVSDRNNECRLVIMVEYPDKSVREVKVIEESNDNVTIIQERTDIYG